MATLAEQKKLILPYLQRADEIQSLNPKVAYYCRLHAIEQALQLPNRAPEIQGVLEALMEKLEQDKPLIAASDDDAAVCEAFAVKVFNLADAQDRAGSADTKTVRAFYAASIFIDMLEHFGELPPDMVERKQYAFWKAADIRKALREGRKPEPGPPAKDDLDLDLPDIPGGTIGMSPAPSSNLSSAPPSAAAANLDPQPPGGLQSRQSAPALPSRFRPGSKVYYNVPNGAPTKGTVVTVTPQPGGAICRVGLSQKIVDVPQVQLAHDFEIGDPVLFKTPAGPAVEASVDKLDASRWPIAYLLTLQDGSLVPTAERALEPAIAQKSAGPSVGARSPSISPSKSRPDLPMRPSNIASSSKAPDLLPDDELQDADSETGEGVPGSVALPPPDRDMPGEHSRGQDNESAQLPSTLGFTSTFAADGLKKEGVPHPSSHAPSSEEEEPGSHRLTPPEYPDLSGAPGGDVKTSLPPSGRAFVQTPPPAALPLSQNEPPRLSAATLSAPPPLQNPSPGYVPPLAAITEAQKMAKYAASSLSFEDVPTAVKHLQKALQLLTVSDAHK